MAPAKIQRWMKMNRSSLANDHDKTAINSSVPEMFTLTSV